MAIHKTGSHVPHQYKQRGELAFPKNSHMRLPRAVSWCIHAAAHLTTYSVRKARSQRRPRILMYHAIDHDFHPRLTEFERQLSLFKRHFHLVALGELLDRRVNGTLSGYEVVLTFDDGIQNHFSTVYPALQRYAAPATFFVCPMLIETGRWIWNMELRARIKSMAPSERQKLALQFGLTHAQPDDLVEWAKTLALGERERFEEVVRQHSSGWRPTSRQNDLSAPLTWSQLCSLDPSLVTVGSHSSTHPILTNIQPAEAEAEIRESRATLEAKLQRPVDCFCYPNGIYNLQVAELARRHYRASVTTQVGLVANHASDHLLPRISAGASDNFSTFLWRLHRG